MRIALFLFALALAPPCFAQSLDAAPTPPLDRPPPGPEEGWALTLGVGPVFSPAWQGSRDMALSIYPDIRLNYSDEIFASVPEGVGWNMVNRDGWKIGPLAKIRFGRDETKGGSPFLVAGGSDALLGLGDVSAAAELGGFVEKRLGSASPLRARLEVRRGFGGHEGALADGSLSYQVRAGRSIVNIGPRVTLASEDYMQTYFGIDAAQSQRSGLAPYSAGGGLLSYGVSG